MHKYLRTVGFSHIESHRMLEEILQNVERNFDRKTVIENKGKRRFAELSKNYGDDCGITLCGELDLNNEFHREYYFPYYRGQEGFICKGISIEQHSDKESYAGVYDDFNTGISLIFYLINYAEYQNKEFASIRTGYSEVGTLALSALSDTGKVLLSIQKETKRDEQTIRSSEKRNSLIAAAQKGDQEAIESLTMEDIDLYALLSRRVQKEDIYSIVKSTFMPCGIECDQYMIIGEIADVAITRNSRTGERLYQIRVVSNDIPVDVCINEMDLMGIPEPGRRFKGKIWLQGMVQK